MTFDALNGCVCVCVCECVKIPLALHVRVCERLFDVGADLHTTLIANALSALGLHLLHTKSSNRMYVCPLPLPSLTVCLL